LMSPAETPDSPRVAALAARINRARMFWEQWNLEASRHRLVMCTQLTADCGDPRSDISGMVFNAAGKAPGSLVAEGNADSLGPWILRWQVLSVDGHITRGEIRFLVIAKTAS